MAQVVDQLRKLKQRIERQFTQRHRNARAHRGLIPIGPFTPHGNAAARRFAQNQRLGTANSSRFKDRETLPFKRMEWMSYFRPSQRLFANLGSPL